MGFILAITWFYFDY